MPKLAVLALFLLSCLSFYATAKEAPLTGTLVVVNKKTHNVSFIDIATKKLVATKKTGRGPHEVAITTDGRWAAVTDYVGGNSLTVFNVASATKVRTIDLAKYPRPHGILFLKDQKHVAVSSEGSDSIVIANIHSGEISQVLKTYQKGSHMVALPESTDKVYTTNMGSDTVSEIEVNSGKLLRTIRTEKTPEAITVNRKGTEIWVGSNEDGLVTVYDLGNGKQVKQWQGFSFPYRILLTTDQKYAVIPDFKNNTLDIFDVESKKKLKQVKFKHGTTPNGVIFHPNDRTLFISAYGIDIVYAIDIPSGIVMFELPAGNGPDGIGYSPIEVVN